eukprot:CAMPEP_0175059472 /NCGR_PEP_ID=MMETSP0052_2-20121109/12451_1 /TAXON_ID=51329 ORGANISM="Polytomella parva, Strain SAG 63-3" /NCGR_SAMPLE_ID=MMETSP0052_2 /ASSEMBLY_ACC=CAM_ASM_000194 /LENGTH=295 /DNA_ID=CAMNT_0016325025 /DNA_START=95 /DNA_END=982 /DNA_ORIENTATION=+
MPKLVAKIEGRGNGIKTNIVNNVDIAKALERPPEYVLKFFGCELGAQTNFDAKSGVSIVNGSHDPKKLSELLEGFIKKYVCCYNCNNPETQIKIKKEDIFLKCKACGFVSTVDMRHKLNTFIIKNPPASTLKKEEKQLKKAEEERLRDAEALAEKDKEKKDKKDKKEKKEKDDDEKKEKKEKKDKKKKDNEEEEGEEEGEDNGVEEKKKEKKEKKKKDKDDKEDGEDEDKEGEGEDNGDEEKKEKKKKKKDSDEEEDEDEDDGVVWMTDTSAEAAKKRAEEQLSAAAAAMVAMKF